MSRSMRTVGFMSRCIRAGAWKGRSGSSCRIVRGAMRRGVVLMNGIAAFVATKGIRHRTSSGRHAASGPISHWSDCLVRKLPPRSWSGMRRFERSSNCWIRCEASLTKGIEIVFRPVEIAECCELWVQSSQVINGNAASYCTIEEVRWSKLVGGEQVLNLRQDGNAINSRERMRELFFDGDDYVGITELVDHGLHEGGLKQWYVATCCVSGCSVGRDRRQAG